jgi:hypothetical protein
MNLVLGIFSQLCASTQNVTNSAIIGVIETKTKYMFQKNKNKIETKILCYIKEL